MTNTSLISKEMVEKYQGKTIRIERYVYIITITEPFGMIRVELKPVSKKQSEVTNEIDIDSGRYYYESDVGQKAIEMAHHIAAEIETGIKADFIVKGDE